MVTTSQVLEMWEGQSTSAERMCADILRLEGFEGIDPQCPLGGPDGGKDILCERNGILFVAACWFPRGQKSWSDAKTKFVNDCNAAKTHKRDGFVFMSNQHFTPAERAELEKIANQLGLRAIIKTREHLRTTLDSPQGYGIRLRSLGIPMSVEEQAAFFASSNLGFSDALARQTSEIQNLSRKLDRLAFDQRAFAIHSLAVVRDAVEDAATKSAITRLIDEDADGHSDFISTKPSSALAINLSLNAVREVHRLVLPEGLATAGKFRATQVWLGDSDGNRNEQLEFPSWEKIPDLLGALLDGWNSKFSTVEEKATFEYINFHVAKFFHHFLLTHPFLDGNGRTARAIAIIQLRYLHCIECDFLWPQGIDYYSALRSADNGDYNPLTQIIQQMTLAEVHRAP